MNDLRQRVKIVLGKVIGGVGKLLNKRNPIKLFSDSAVGTQST